MSYFLEIYLKFFVLLTPFFVLSVFVGLTARWTPSQRRVLAVQVTLSVMVICLVLYFFGNALFSVLGITLDSFRVGAGGLMFISAVKMVQGVDDPARVEADQGVIAVVPLAIPVTVGPGTTGALLVMGAEDSHAWSIVVGCLALIASIATVGAILLAGTRIERVVGKAGVAIFSKLSGLFLAALAAQLVLTGVRNVLFPQPSSERQRWSWNDDRQRSDALQLALRTRSESE